MILDKWVSMIQNILLGTMETIFSEHSEMFPNIQNFPKCLTTFIGNFSCKQFFSAHSKMFSKTNLNCFQNTLKCFQTNINISEQMISNKWEFFQFPRTL